MQTRQIVLPALLLAAACGMPDVAPASASSASIQSFTASPASIAAGETATLRASYSDGTGTIDQGIGPIGSGASVLVAPTASKIYTLTVTDGMGNAVTRTASVTVAGTGTYPVAGVTASPPALTNQTTASFSFTSSKAGSTFACQLDTGTASACTSPRSYSGLAAGSHAFAVTATDQTGNVSAPAYVTWTIDLTPPAVTIATSTANPTNQTTASFSFSSSKSGSTFSCNLDSGATAACTAPRGYAGLLAGSHVFTVTATDAAGNVSVPASFAWTVDLTPPVATITASPASPTNQTTASFSFMSSQAGSTFSCKLDAGPSGACTNPQSYSGLAAGSHTFTVTAVDPAGNASTPASYTWTIDLTALLVTITASPANPSNQTTASFSFSASTAGSTFSCTLDAAAATACTSPQSYTGLAAGNHAFSVTATDPTGKVSSPASFTWTIDLTPPVVSITAAPPALSNQTTATFSFNSSEAGSTFSCTLDSGAPASCTSPRNYSGLVAGGHTFTVTAADRAANLAAPASFTWTIDLTAPVATITASPANPTNQTAASFSFSSSKAGSTLNCKLDTATAAACTSPQSYSALAAGSHTFSVTATDQAGNASAPASFAWTIDLTPPVATITASPPNPTTLTTASFSFTSNQAGSTFRCTLDAAAAAACTSPQSYSGLAAGSHTFSVTATDQAGNVSAATSFTWTITSGGGLVISSPLTLDKSTVAAGDTLNGTVTYQNTSASPIAVQIITITSRPPGTTPASGPYDDFTPTAPAQTIQPGATLTLAASRLFLSSDPLGSWYSYTTYQDSALAWHDGPHVSFTVAAPAPSISVAVTPSVASATPGGTITFQATVSGTATGQSTAVTWLVAVGGGTIDQTGVYVAPATAGTYTVVATSVADPTKTGIASVNVGTSSNIIAPDRRTSWNPGIPGGIPSRTTLCATLNAATYGNGTTDATSAIQAAINACPEGQVVYLPAGTYRVTSNLTIAKGIVLRGDGPTLTKIRASLAAGSVAVIYMANLWPTYGSAVNVTADVPKDATSVPVANGSAFAAGNIVQIDQLDDTSYLFDGNCQWFKRPDYGPPTTGHRSQGQTVEVVSVVGNTLNLSTPMHQGFKLAFAPQVFKPSGPAAPAGSTEPPGIVKYAGLEKLYLTGGQNDQISIVNCAYCWIANVESDGTTPAASTAANGTAGPGNGMKGAHVLIDRSFRVVIRDSYFHHATNVVQGGGAYGLSFSAHTSDSLVENNIIYYMNKPLTMRATGGGNVVAYNYVDNAWTSADSRLQETTIDMGHASFPYMELVEGNQAAQIATEAVWGNSGWMTLFRNYASSQQQRTAANETYQIAAVAFEVKARFMNVVGNVLGTPGLGLLYEVNSSPPGPDQKTVYRLGHGVNAGGGGDDISTYESPIAPAATALQLYRHGNYDYVTGTVVWDPTNLNHTLPASLYLSSKPAFFGANPWPWVDPVGTTKLYTLPAKARWDSGNPNP